MELVLTLMDHSIVLAMMVMMGTDIIVQVFLKGLFGIMPNTNSVQRYH